MLQNHFKTKFETIIIVNRTAIDASCLKLWNGNVIRQFM